MNSRRPQLGLRLPSASRAPILTSPLLVLLLLGSPLTGQVRGVKDIFPGTYGSSPKKLLAWKGHVYFVAEDHLHGVELWRSDGTSSGTQLVKDVAPGLKNSDPSGLTVAGDKLFFTAKTPALGRELYVTDGTAAGTRMVKDIAAGNRDGALAILGEFRGRVYLTGRPGRTGNEALWVSDGSAAGTDRFDPKRRLSSGPGDFIRFGDRFLLATTVSSVIGRELYVSNGTPGGTTLLKDIYPGSRDSKPANFRVIGSKCYFTASDPAHGGEPWVTDGTPQGTRMVTDLIPGSGNSFAYGFTGTETSVFFTAKTPSNGTELYWTDGHRVQSHDIYPGYRSSSPRDLTSIGPGEVMFSADSSLGRELWRASRAGQVLVKDIQRFAGSSSPLALAAVNARHVLFTADDGKLGYELWRSDGTSQGTAMVQDLCLGSCDAHTGPFVQLGCKVFFAAKTKTVGRELFVMDIGATSQVVGRGCAPGVRIPALSSSDPVLNSTVNLSVSGAPTSKNYKITAVTVIGDRAPVPFLLEGCPIYINPTLPHFLFRHTIASASFQYQLGKVPNHASLNCLPLTVQVLFAGLPHLETTNGLSLYMGR